MIGELYPGEFEAMEHNGRMDALEQESFEDWCDVPSDEMTLEQARQAVKDLRKKLVEYLEQEPCGDAISRAYIEPIIEELENICVNGDEYILDLLASIKNAPPVIPQPKMGKWIYKKDLKQFFCNKCEYPSLTDDDKYIYSMDLPNFCENCGAKMVDPQESEETDADSN